MPRRIANTKASPLSPTQQRAVSETVTRVVSFRGAAPALEVPAVRRPAPPLRQEGRQPVRLDRRHAPLPRHGHLHRFHRCCALCRPHRLIQEQQRPLILFSLCYPRDNYYLLFPRPVAAACVLEAARGLQSATTPARPCLTRGAGPCVNCVESSAEPHEAWRGTPFVYFYDL